MWDPVWEQIFSNHEWGKYPGEDLIRFVARSFYQAPVRKDVRLLEVGCGPGANLWYLAREGFSFQGVDGSTTAIRRAGERLDRECPGWREGSGLQVGDIQSLAYADASFDAVIDNEAIYCNSMDISRTIYQEMARVTRPGGKLYSRTFACGSWGDGTGEPLGHNAWACSEGPLAGKGHSRFTSREEIPALIAPFVVASVEKLSYTVGDGAHAIHEWIITATLP